MRPGLGRWKRPQGAGAHQMEVTIPAKTTKMSGVLRLLCRSNDASIADLQKATGWQPHSVRSALTGLRKKSHAVQRSKDPKGIAIYSVAREAE